MRILRTTTAFHTCLNPLSKSGIGAGGAYVDSLLKSFLADALSLAARENDPPTVEYEEIFEYVSDGLRDFRQSGKRRFHSPTATYHVCVGGRQMNSEVPPIRRGVLTLEGSDLFESLLS